MAKTGSNIVVTKQDPKLEAFLKLKLPEDVYDKIRTYEPCIVHSVKEKNKFKYMVLSDERIYITENPPKIINEEDSVHLGDITRIELINDYPDFLQGEQRDNALHICIKYLEEVKVQVKNKKRRSKSKSKERTSPVPDLIITGNLEESDRLNQSANSKSSSLASLHSKHRSLDESEFLSGVSDDDLLDVNSNSSSDRLGNSLPVSELKRLAMSISDTSSEYELNVDNTFGKKRSHSMSATTEGETCRPLPQRPSSNPSDPIPKVDEPKTYTSQVATTLIDRRKSFSSSSSSTSLQRSLPSPDVVNDSKKKSQPFQFPRSSSTSTIDSSPENMHNSLQRLSVGRTRSLEVPLIDEGAESDSQEIVEIIEKQERELHLYILSANSPVLMLLRSTWNNYTIHATLLEDSEYAGLKGHGYKGSSKGRKPSREQLSRLFQQLKNEILNSSESMEVLFHLVQELNNAAEKYFFLKILFWKNNDLFGFIIRQLHRYLPKTSVNLNTDRGRHHRADELELCTLLLETLGVMFRGTEMISARLDTLVANNGKPTLDLVVLTTCLPEVPVKWRPPKTKAASLLLETDTENWKTYADAEVAKLVQELCNASTAVMFDLVLIAYQANWGNEEGRFFNICWLMKVLDSLQTTTYTFVERILAQAMKLLMPSRDETLTPNQAVLLFQEFFLLQTFLQYSSCVPSHIRNNYTEEFRYYMRSPHIVDKLPSKYPITKPALQLISEVLGSVLQKHTSLQSTK